MKEWIAEVFGVLGRNAWISHLWDTCVMTSVVILLLLLIRPLLKRLPRNVAYVLWIVVAVQILCPVSMQGIYRALPRQVSEQVSERKQTFQMEKISNVLQSEEVAAGGHAEGLENVDDHIVQEVAQIVPAKEKEKTKPVFTAVQGVLGVWGLGTAVCVILLIVSLVRNKRRFADAILWEDNIYMHEAVENSFVGGVIAPKIYLSSKLCGDECGRERELILCHERVHVKRRDYLIKIVCFLAFSVLWFNPLCWAAYHFFVLDMEVSCDEAVIRRLGTQARKEYSYLLLAMADKGRYGWFQEPAFSISSVKERIVRVMRYQKPRRFISVVSVVIVLLCSCGIASQPETVKKLTSHRDMTKDAVQFVETMVDEDKDFKEFAGKMDATEVFCHNVDSDGRYYELAALRTGYSYHDFMKIKWVDGAWKKEKVPWDKALTDYVKIIEEDRCWYSMISIYEGEEGQIYVAMEKYDVPDDEKHYKSPKKVIENRLLRYDAENDRMVKVKAPKVFYNRRDESGKQTGERVLAENQVLYYIFHDNKVLLNHYEEEYFGWYDLTTGERIDPASELYQEYTASWEMVKGDGVIATFSRQNGETIDINIYDLDEQKHLYTMPTDLKVSDVKKEIDNGSYFYDMDIRDNAVYLLTRNGVDKAEIGDDTWTRVMEPKTSRVYYYTEEKMETPNMFVVNDSEFYLNMHKRISESGAQPYYFRYSKAE